MQEVESLFGLGFYLEALGEGPDLFVVAELAQSLEFDLVLLRQVVQDVNEGATSQH